MLCIVRQVHVSSKTIIIIIIIIITKPLAETDGAGLTTHHVNSAECAAYHQFYSLRDRWRRYRRCLLLRNTNHHWWQWHCHNGCCRTNRDTSAYMPDQTTALPLLQQVWPAIHFVMKHFLLFCQRNKEMY